MIFDSSVKELIKRAYDVQKDVILRLPLSDFSALSSDGIKTVVLFPGAYFSGPESPFSSYCGKNSPTAYLSAPDLLFADVRFMGDASFREFLTRKKYRRIAPVFSECAIVGEYGYRESFSWIGEYRAEISRFCQVTPFLTPCAEPVNELLSAFGTKDALIVGEKVLPDFTVCKTHSPSEKFRYTAAEAEKHAFRKVCIYFNSRNEEMQFAGFLQKRGTPFISVNGENTAEEFSRKLKKYRDSDINILLATKSFIPSSVYLSPEKTLMCGVPFSLSHISRCQSFSSSLRVIYCEEDFERNGKILSSFSEQTDNEEVYKKGLIKLSEIKKYLEND